MHRTTPIALAALAAALSAAQAPAADRPETSAYPFREAVAAAGGSYAATTVGTNFVVSGTISEALSFSGSEPYRVTLSGATVSKTITLSGEAQLWLEGENAVETTAATAISSTGTLTIGGPGSVVLASAPTKKQTGPVVAEDLVVYSFRPDKFAGVCPRVEAASIKQDLVEDEIARTEKVSPSAGRREHATRNTAGADARGSKSGNR